MSTGQDKLNPIRDSERPVPLPATGRPTKLAILLTLLVTSIGCPPSPPPRPDPPTPVEPDPDDSPAPNEDPSSTPSNDRVSSQHEPTDPIDLGTAVQETKQIFRKHGLPEDWYQSLTTVDKDRNHSVLVSAIWTMVGPEVAARFQERYHTVRTPAARVSSEELFSDNIVFDELLYRTFRGDQHGDLHTNFNQRFRLQQERLPNVNPQFVERNGAVAFSRLHDAIIAELRQLTQPVTVNDRESVSNEDDESCRVVGQWQSPAKLPAWAASRLVWRPVIRVEFVEGDRTQGNVINKGDRRLGLSCYAQVGHRDNENASIIPFYLAGPYRESYYQPVGEAIGASEAFVLVPEQRTCPHDGLVYRDLETLNTQPTESDQPRNEAAETDSRPAAEIPHPKWTGGSGFGEPLREMHDKLSVLIRKP